MNEKSRIRAKCIFCNEPIFFRKSPKMGEIITCTFCDEKLEVIQLDPVILDLPWDTESLMDEFYMEEEFDY